MLLMNKCVECLPNIVYAFWYLFWWREKMYFFDWDCCVWRGSRPSICCYFGLLPRIIECQWTWNKDIICGSCTPFTGDTWPIGLSLIRDQTSHWNWNNVQMVFCCELWTNNNQICFRPRTNVQISAQVGGIFGETESQKAPKALEVFQWPVRQNGHFQFFFLICHW